MRDGATLKKVKPIPIDRHGKLVEFHKKTLAAQSSLRSRSGSIANREGNQLSRILSCRAEHRFAVLDLRRNLISASCVEMLSFSTI